MKIRAQTPEPKHRLAPPQTGNSGRDVWPLELTSIRTGAEFERYQAANLEERLQRHAIARSLVGIQEPFHVAGRCYVCRRQVPLAVDFSYAFEQDGIRTPNWREHLTCPGCGLNSRMRAAVHVVAECGAVGSNSVYVTEQTTGLFRVLRACYPDLVGSEYLGAEVPFGSDNEQGTRNECITRLTFPDNAFDFILSFDVFEHVPDYHQGLAECLRCMKPGGQLIFTVPFTTDPETLVRARVMPDGTISHLQPPEYHADPLTVAGCLCFYHFGWDLLDILRSLGFDDVRALVYWSREYGYISGEPQMIFSARK